MTSSGLRCLHGGGLDEQSIRESSSMAHLVAVLVFLLLWKLHRFLGKTLLDDIFNASLVLFGSQNAILPSDDDDVDLADEVDKTKSPEILAIPADDDLWLQKKCPNSTYAERLRFYLDNKTKNKPVSVAARSLEVYLDWRRRYSQWQDEVAYSKTGDEDLDQWNMSTLLAYKLQGVKGDPRLLPRIVRTYKSSSEDHGDHQHLCDNLGARVFHVTPGKMDERICSTPTYATALAIYLDRNMSRESTEQICVVLDVRGGVGWRNLNAVNQLPFIQQTCQLLSQMFPERLSRALVYPIPASFMWLWNMAARCIDVETRNKIAVLQGVATVVASPPTEQMLAYMSEEAANRLEQERIAAFVP